MASTIKKSASGFSNRMARYCIAILIYAGCAFSQTNTARMLSGINAQTGTTYTFTAADSTRLTTFSNSSVISAILPSGSTANFGAGSLFSVKNIGSGNLSIVCQGCTINGSGTLVLTTGQGADLYSDGLNYVGQSGSGGGGGGTGNVTTTPGSGVSQNILQQVNTNYGSNVVNGTRYAFQYNWLQSPSGTLTAAIPATVTLTPCPIGIDATGSATFPYYVYVAAQGTPEAVVVTGGTCTSGAASGNITFTPANSHGAGFTVQSATTGIAEAANDPQVAPFGSVTFSINREIKLQPAASNVNANTFAFIMYAPWFLRNSMTTVDGAGAVIAVQNPRAGIVITNGGAYGNIFRDIRWAASGNYLGSPITNTVCTADMATITVANTFNPGDQVDIQFTKAIFYWGVHTVVTASATQFTYAATGCSQPNIADIGNAAEQFSAYEDNAGFGVAIENNHWDQPGLFSGKFNNGIVVHNDQGLTLNWNTTLTAGRCDSTYCGNWLYSPGGGGDSSVISWNDNFLSLSCGWNGVTIYSGNTFKAQGGVIQGSPMWSVKYGNQKGNFGGSLFNGVYEEVGGCTNPLYTPNQQVGNMQYGQTLSWTGGEGPIGANPQFASGGATAYNYFLVVNDSVNGPSAPLLIGFAQPSGNAVTVKWPRAIDANTTTYDVLRWGQTASNNFAPYTAACTGGSTTACGSVVVGQAQCSALQCSFTDDVSVNTTSYTVATPVIQGSGVGGAGTAGNVPDFAFFPGNIVLQNGATLDFYGSNIDSQYLASGTRGAGLVALNGVGPVTTDAPPKKSAGYAQVNSLRWNRDSQLGELIYEPFISGGSRPNSKGRIHFVSPLQGASGGGFGTGQHWITLADCTSQQTLAAPWPRAAEVAGNPDLATICSTGIGTDHTAGTSFPANVNLAFTNPNSISNYINSLMDGSSWKERLTSTLKSFTVNVTTSQQYQSTLATGTTPLVIASTTPVANLTVSNHSTFQDCGATTTCANTQKTGTILVMGRVSFPTATTVTVTQLPFTSATSYVCSAQDVTTAAGVINATTYTSGSSVTFTETNGTNTDAMRYRCDGF